MRRYRGSRDANHAAIAAAFASLGCSVADCALAGIEGFPDMVVGCVGVNHLVEVKNPDTDYGRRGLNGEQSEFARHWRGETVVVIYFPETVPALVQLWRSRFKPNATGEQKP